MMKVLVTGGCGFIGSHVVDRLSKEATVSIYDDLSTSLLTDEVEPTPRYPENSLVRDTRRVSNMTQIPHDTEVVVHAASRYPIEREASTFWHAYQGFVSDATWIFRYLLTNRSLKRFVVVSTNSIYDLLGRTQGPGALVGALRQVLRYWHRPPALSIEFIHLPEVFGPRRVTGSYLIPGLEPTIEKFPRPCFDEYLYIDDAVDFIVQRALGGRPRRSVDFAPRGHYLDPKTVRRIRQEFGLSPQCSEEEAESAPVSKDLPVPVDGESRVSIHEGFVRTLKWQEEEDANQ